MFTLAQMNGANGAPDIYFTRKPHVRVADNRRVGFSKQADGVTDADGTLYTINATNQAYSGLIQSELNTEYLYNHGYNFGSDLYILNQKRVKTFDNNGFTLGSLIYAKIASLYQYGDENVITNTTTSCIAFQKLYEITSTTFMALRWNGTNTEAVVGTIASDGSITWGTGVAIIASQKAYNSIWVEQVSATKYIALYQNGANIEARCWTVSGTTVTMGTALTVAARSASSFHVRTFTTDKVVATYYVGSTCYYCVLTIATTTITNVGEQTISANGVYPMVEFDTSGAGGIFVYPHSSATGLMAKAFTISGNVLTLGTETTIDPRTGWYTGNWTWQLANIRSTAKYMYVIGSGSNTKGNVIVMTRSTTTVAVNTYNTVNNYGQSTVGQGGMSINAGGTVMVQHASTAGLFYHYSQYNTTADETGGGGRLLELTYSATDDTVSFTSHELACNAQTLGFLSSFSNNGFAYGHIGTSDLLFAMYSSVYAQTFYYLGKGETVKLYSQTYNGSLQYGTALATLDTTWKSIAFYRYNVGASLGVLSLNLALEKTTSGTAILRLWRACFSTS